MTTQSTRDTFKLSRCPIFPAESPLGGGPAAIRYAQHTAALHNKKSLVSLSARSTDRPIDLRSVCTSRVSCAMMQTSIGHVHRMRVVITGATALL
jgi:hypothetical protein